ncbi:MAG: UDP-N-acetylmuramate dehydrogenase [Chitinivibrionales bacterium]|nr:UDP-N-acetylmuramate dehydrogenase [Chitinivibrionales bacterium]
MHSGSFCLLVTILSCSQTIFIINMKRPPGSDQSLSDFFAKYLHGDCLPDEPLSRHTSYRVGGPADYFVYPRDRDDILRLLTVCRRSATPTFFLGDGANVLAADEGFRGVVICLTKYFTSISHNGLEVLAECGVPLEKAVRYCEQHSLGGIEYHAGIPGTLGGALTMNAGTDKGEIGGRVVWVELIDETLELVTMPREEIFFGYRSAPQLQGKALLRCKLSMLPADFEILRQRRESQVARRSARQPVEYPSCGSVFKRPPGRFVGQMVEASGLKGTRHGDAMISQKHAGFIVNMGTASAGDILHLIRLIKTQIKHRYGVDLECELKFLGFNAYPV